MEIRETLLIGHTTGIGKAIYRALEIKEGVSKSTGFDINESHPNFNYKKYGCIILNAYDKFNSQLNTLFEIAENVDKQTLIIVIGSTSAYKTNPTDLYWAKYAIEKAAIVKAGRDLNTMGYNIAVLSPGTVDTHRNEGKTCDKLSPFSIATSVLEIMDKYKDGILIEHTVIRTVKH